MKKKIFILFVAMTTIIACKKSSNTNTNNSGNTEEPISLLFDTTTCILNPNQIGLIKEVYPDYIIISGQNLGQNKTSSNVSAINIHENGYFVSEPNIKFPLGTFNKVFKITPYGVGDFKAEFFPYDPNNPQISICEALEAGSYKNLVPVTDKVTDAVDENGNPFPIEFDGSKLKLTISKTFDWDGNTATTDDKVEVSGVLKTNLDLDVNLRVKNWQLEKFSSEAKVKFDGELSVKASLALMEQKKTFKICDYHLKPITLLVGGVFPIVINPVVTISAVISEKGEVSIEGTVLKYSGDVSQGFDYTQANGFKLIGTENLPPLSSALNPALTASFEGEVKLSPEVLIEYRLYDKDVSVSTGLGLYGKFKATAEATTADPNIFDLHAILTAGMEGKVKGKLKLFNKNIADKELAFTIAEITLWDNKKFLQNWYKNLVLDYSFNQTLKDASKLECDLILKDASSNVMTPAFESDRHSIPNNAYLLNEGANGVTFLKGSCDSKVLTRTNNEVTINFWFKGNPNNTNDVLTVFQVQNENDILAVALDIDNFTGNSKIKFFDNSILNEHKSLDFLISNTIWQMITITKDVNTVKFYKNSILINSVPFIDGSYNGNLVFNTQFLRSLWNSPRIYNLDDFKIYNKVLSSQEITNLFNE